MAKKLNTETAAAASKDPLENVAARRTVIRKGFRSIYSVEKQIADLTEKHLAKLRQERTKLWRDLKAATDIPRKQMKPDYDKFKLAMESRDYLADDEGERLLDNLREVHNALHPGETVDWVALMEAADEEQPATSGKSKDLADITRFGAGAALDGKPRTDNPHAEGTAANDAWDKGWHNGDKQRVINEGKKKPAASEEAVVH